VWLYFSKGNKHESTVSKRDSFGAHAKTAFAKKLLSLNDVEEVVEERKDF